MDQDFFDIQYDMIMKKEERKIKRKEKTSKGKKDRSMVFRLDGCSFHVAHA